MTKQVWIGVLATGTVWLLLAAGCGGDAATSEGGAGATPAPTSAPAATPSPVEVVDAAAWVGGVNGALQTHRDTFPEEGDALLRAELRLEAPDKGPFLAFWRAQAEWYRVLAGAIPDPAPATVQQGADDFVEAVAALADEFDVLADQFENDPAVDAWVETGDHEAPLPDAYFGQLAQLGWLDLQCADLQTVVNDAGLGLIDCLGTVAESAEAEPEELTAEPDGVVAVPIGQHFLDAGGTYLFEDFGRPFTVSPDLDWEALHSKPTDALELAEGGFRDGRGLIIQVVAPDELADPATMVHEDFSMANVIAVPADLDDWFNALPIPVESSGALSARDGLEIPWWRLQPPADPNDPNAEGVFAFADTPGALQPMLFAPGSIFFQIPHPDGLVIVTVLPWGPLELDELFEGTAALLATVAVPA